MIRIFEKVDKSPFNTFGIEEVDEKDTFVKSPCVVVILAKTWLLSSVNGAMKYVMNLVNQGKHNDNRRILGLAFGELHLLPAGLDYTFSQDEPTKEDIKGFVDEYLLPYVCKDGKKITTEEAMHNLRNLNFLTYCNGSMIYRRIEKDLEDKMRELGYSDEQINLILSQVTLCAVSGDAELNTNKATTLLFTDNKDTIDEGLDTGVIKYDGYYRYVRESDGSHDFTKYMSKDPVLSSSIKCFLNSALNENMIDQKPFMVDTLMSINDIQSSDIEYTTYKYMNDSVKDPVLRKLYWDYEDGSITVDVKDLHSKIGIYPDDKEPLKPGERYIEVAHKGGEVVGFSYHGLSYDGYELENMVVLPQYRHQGLGTELYNKTLANTSKSGYDSLSFLTARGKQEAYGFFKKQGASQIGRRLVSNYIGYTEIAQMQVSNIKERLEALKQARLERK